MDPLPPTSSPRAQTMGLPSSFVSRLFLFRIWTVLLLNHFKECPTTGGTMNASKLFVCMYVCMSFTVEGILQSRFRAGPFARQQSCHSSVNYSIAVVQ